MDLKKLAFFSIFLTMFPTKTLAFSEQPNMGELITFLYGDMLDLNSFIKVHPTEIADPYIPEPLFEKDETEDIESELITSIPELENLAKNSSLFED